MKDNKLFLKSPIKWAGGKSKLMNKIQEVYNNDFFWNSEKYTYIELFGGGGSSWLFVLQNYRPKRVIVNDINPNVINLWRCIQNYPIALCGELESIVSNYLNFDWDGRKEFFLDLRKSFNEKKDLLTGINTDVRMAAEFLFLNKTCFNGLWRTNSKGEFNTPFESRQIWTKNQIYMIKIISYCYQNGLKELSLYVVIIKMLLVMMLLEMYWFIWIRHIEALGQITLKSLLANKSK